MAITAKMYANLIVKALNKEVSIVNGGTNLKIMLCTNAYAVNQDTHIYKSSVTNEVTGTGYTAGGLSLSSVTLALDAATNTIKLDAADVTWPTSTLTARYAVIYDNAPSTDATKPLIGYIDFGGDVSSYAGDFTIIFNTSGILTFTIE